METKKRIMINGCFDMLHPGHLYLIKEAKKLGDFLIIGINSDECRVKQGKRKPVIPAEKRKEMLEAIRYVDKVEIYDETHPPQELIKKYNPDIVVAGEEEGVKENLIKEGTYNIAKIIPRLKGWSSTKLIKEIKKR